MAASKQTSPEMNNNIDGANTSESATGVAAAAAKSVETGAAASAASTEPSTSSGGATAAAATAAATASKVRFPLFLIVRLLSFIPCILSNDDDYYYK